MTDGKEGAKQTRILFFFSPLYFLLLEGVFVYSLFALFFKSNLSMSSFFWRAIFSAEYIFDLKYLMDQLVW